jgi:uncharacterized protein (DUF58 family)
VRPTALGLKALAFHGLLTAAFYVSPYTNLFFLLLSFFVALLLLGAFWTWRNLRRVRARVEAPQVLAAGAAGTVEVLVEAGHPAALVAVEVRFAGPPDAHLDGRIGGPRGRRRDHPVAEFAELRPGQAERRSGSLPPLGRGRHPVSGWRVRSSAPLGLWTASLPADGPAEVLVHAAPLDPAEARAAGLGAEPGSRASAALGPDGEAGVAGLRAWRQGDALRAVHWRATARRRRPIVRECDPGRSERSLTVSFDRRGPAGPAFEHALSTLVSLALRARSRGETLELRTQGRVATFGQGREPIEALLAWTATAAPCAPGEPPPPVAPRGALRLPDLARSGGATR